ncbi:MAG: AAA family ATPase [Candidatus Lokiarchaeota archaeon]
MKLTKFHITDYGPLPDRGSKELADFNLFYGKNESGKTLTIDALIKFLIGTTFKQYIHLDRIEARPEGFVKLKQGSAEIKLKDNKKISDLIDISNQEFGKLFIIRDSDLAFSEREEFYKNITDTLLGLRLNDIEDILSNINDRCNLTPTGMFSDRSPYKLKTKIETAEDTISEIESLITKLKDEDFDIFEEQITRKRYEKIGLEDELNHYREAQKRELYEKSKTALDKYVENEEIIKNLEIFSDKSKTEWIEQKETLKNVANNYNSQKEELEQKESYIQQLRSEIAEKSQKIEVPKKIKSNLDEAIKLNLNAYKKESVGLKKALEKETLFRNLIYISAIIFFALLLSGSISSQLILDILSFVFLIICICMIIILYMNLFSFQGFQFLH